MYVHGQRFKRKSHKPKLFLMLVILVVTALVLSAFQTLYKFPSVKGEGEFSASVESTAKQIPWPSYGQSAIGAVGYGVLDSSSNKQSQPTASVAKVMTALAVLNEKPLELGSQGEQITFTAEDAALFGEYWQKNGTSVKIAEGEQISQRKALEYILIPSANNVADSLANWAFGSMEQYLRYANEYADELGLVSTVINDASGFSPHTKSTASDLVLLGEHAMNNPVIADIVKIWEISLPDGNKSQNSNKFLDFEGNGVVGIKTGDTDQAGGVYLFAANHIVEGEEVTLLGSVMGAKTLFKAEEDGMMLLNSIKNGFSKKKVASAGEIVGAVNVPWAGQINIALKDDVEVLMYKGIEPEFSIEFDSINSDISTGTEVGELVVKIGSKESRHVLITTEDIEQPPLSWRLRHPQLLLL